jgi:hypothetical protein
MAGWRPPPGPPARRWLACRRQRSRRAGRERGRDRLVPCAQFVQGLGLLGDRCSRLVTRGPWQHAERTVA